MTLQSEFAQILAQMEMVSHGTTMRWNPSGGTGESDLPPGEPHPMHEHWRQRWLNATPDRRPGVLEDARAALSAWRVQNQARGDGETWDQLAQRIVDEGLGWSPSEVAQALHVTESQVRKARERYKRHVETGHHTATVVTLHRGGRSVREIARLTGLPPATVQRRIDDYRTRRAA